MFLCTHFSGELCKKRKRKKICSEVENLPVDSGNSHVDQKVKFIKVHGSHGSRGSIVLVKQIPAILVAFTALCMFVLIKWNEARIKSV